MATSTKAAPSKIEIPWPKNLVIEGLLSFPITSEADLEALTEWRTRRKINPPEYPDKIGANLLLTEDNYRKAVTYLAETYLPFARRLKDEFGRSKALDADLVDELIKQVSDEKWTVAEGRKEKPNLPLRYLTPKDRENAPDGYEYKIKFSGPFEKDFPKKAIIKQDGVQVTVPLSQIELPDERKDPDALWWGANWHFRTSLRMNAFENAAGNGAVTAYGNALYLLPHLGLPVTGGAGDAAVLEDGDDWEE
jgi:hypothetical protein